MRILVVSQYFWPENFRINELVRELVNRGHQVTVLTGVPNYPQGKVYEDFINNPNAYVNYEGAKVFRVPVCSRGSNKFHLLLNFITFALSATFLGAWRLRGVPIDVVFVFEPSPVTVGLPAAFLSRVKKTPIVFWVLDLWPETLVALGIFRSPIIIVLVEYLVRFIYGACTLILCQSQSFCENVKKYCQNNEKIHYFPNWAEDVFNGDFSELAPEVPKKSDIINIMFAGNIGEAQDIPAILEAIDNLKGMSNIRWLMVGDGSKLNWLRSEVVKRNLNDKVLILGNFPLSRMPSFYAHADILLVSLKRAPVFTMTIPGKIQSYLMSGIPLIGMLDGEGASIIQNAKAGITCDAGNSMGLVQAVTTLANMSPKKRREFGENGRAYALKEFESTKLFDKLENLLDRAICLHRKSEVKR